MKEKYANLDLLRAFAVLSVVGSHLWQEAVNLGIHAGIPAVNDFVYIASRTGVAFFFVHTCLVLLMSLKRSPAGHLFRNFWIRRAFRIYPLCWEAILLVITTHLTDAHFEGVRSYGVRAVVVNALLLQNFVKTGHSGSILGPLWSLPWEVQMYLVLPFFFLLLNRFRQPATAYVVWAVCTGLGYFGTLPGVEHMGWAIFPPMFAGGMVAYQLLSRKRTSEPPLPWCFCPLILLCLFLVPPFILGGRDMWDPIADLVNGTTCMLVGTSVALVREIKSPWLVRPAQEIAKYSYGIYLLHVPSIWLVYSRLPKLWHPLQIVLGLVITAIVSVASYHLIEYPLIRIGKRLTLVRPVQKPAPATASIKNQTHTAIAAPRG